MGDFHAQPYFPQQESRCRDRAHGDRGLDHDCLRRSQLEWPQGQAQVLRVQFEALPEPGLATPTRTSDNPTPTAAATTTVSRCRTSGLRLRLEPGGASVAQGQYRLALVLTNTSGRSCTLQGFPGVDLKGPADTVNGPTYSLRRQAAMAARVTLRAGQSAGSQLTDLVGDGEAKPWKPTTVVLTPPNETTPLTVAWTGNSVLRQDGATHPGSYIGPMQAR